MKAAYKVLHDKAMEFVDEAQLAKMNDNISAAKAFQLEKEAALIAPDIKASSFAIQLPH